MCQQTGNCKLTTHKRIENITCKSPEVFQLLTRHFVSFIIFFFIVLEKICLNTAHVTKSVPSRCEPGAPAH